MPQKGDHLLQRPLYAFDLPEEILATLILKPQGERPQEDTTSHRPLDEPLDKAESEDGTPTKATSCNLCSLTFLTVEDQRGHVRSDLHGYNLKQKMRGLKPVGEADFEKLVGELDESISGSESSESESEEDETEDGSKPKETTLTALLKKQAKISNPEFDNFATKTRKRGSGAAPIFWFTTPSLPENMSLGIYRAIFSDAEQEEECHIVDAIRRKQLGPTTLPKSKVATSEGGVAFPSTHIGPHYFLCMIGGGHFAAMVVSLAPQMGKKHTGVDERQATVIAHKTFHRYTTRRKQGGAQSTNDASKGAAHSAGSSLRRYNEAALTNEVRELLKDWKSMIDTAELLFIRATGSTNRRTLFGPYDGQLLRNNDPRNRGFPFSTRRATQTELMRCFVELTRVKTSTADEAALVALNAPFTASTPATPPAKSTKPPKPSKEDEIAALHTTQLTSLIRRSKVPALLSYLSSNDLSPSFQFVPSNHHTPTPLHLAASLNVPPVVQALLTKARADPTALSDDARTPFSLAGDRATRDAFRVARAELGESAWDWEAAGVPAPLSKAEVAKREQREKAEKADADKQEAERRKAETERLRKQSEQEEAARREKKIGKGKALGGVPEKTGAEKREEESRGLTPEVRARLERERRARAAEERIRRLQGS
ncbi:hypothetical protein K432DRAFT_401921 [Lepidopterella palustris CBS 459.81]|uniref:VLRF1 domain-containing protein n=1 Tax=Lepidopterella palustris CBS 459.81 TaxID=1314670 RepID=A0A8E2EGS9_9PEZI|nr:hypothetical protein K432DRAFT_401921 [Lepidopterella palustris CBS 459.81]